MVQHYVISPCWWDVWIKLSSLPQYKMDREMMSGSSHACCSISCWPFRWCMDMRRWRPICSLQAPIHHVRPSIFEVTRQQAPIQYSDPIQPSSEQMLITGSNTSLLTDIRSVAVRYFKISWEVIGFELFWNVSMQARINTYDGSQVIFYSNCNLTFSICNCN